MLVSAWGTFVVRDAVHIVMRSLVVEMGVGLRVGRY